VKLGAASLPAVMVAVATSVLLSACGGDDPAVEPAEQQSTADTEHFEHIHGLGVAGGTLYVATHGGLFEAVDGEQELRRTGDSRQDIMGFSVAGADRFIGSGHPAPDDGSMPPNLGLIESRDGGRTWESISLLGEADFHVLESAGTRIYGFDSSGARLMVSDDGGRRWAERTPPAALFDLAVDPRDADRLVTSTERGVFSSADAGKSWRPLRDDTAGLLAWPAADRLYLVDGGGQAQLSADGGRRWRPVGSIGGEPAAFIAHDSDLFAALADGTVRRSTDGGATWTLRAR
jgi:photosystem II stability/assembly factor-like uncharacterized protein